MLPWLTVLFVAAIVLLLVLTTRLAVHPFLALLACALAYGLAADMSLAWTLRSIGDAMAASFGTAGLMLLSGAVLAVFLDRSGAGARLGALIAGDRRRRPLWAMTVVAGVFGGIAASVEAAFLLMAPLVRALSAAAGLTAARVQLSLGFALLAGHTLVVPAPAPVIVATILGADMPRTLGYGLVAAFAAALVGGAFAALSRRSAWKGTKSTTEPANGSGPSEGNALAYGTPAALMAIVLPLLLLVVGSVGQLPNEPFGGGRTRELLTALGGPVTVLVVVLFLALVLPARRGGSSLLGEPGWLGPAVGVAAPVLLITAAGAGLGRVLQNSGLPDLAAEAVAGMTGGLGLLVPFALAAVIRIAQGSPLVAMISAAGFCELLLSDLGLADESGRVLAALAIGAGAVIGSHGNDSLFWVVTRTIGLTPAAGYRLQTLGSTCAGLAALMTVLALRGLGG